jgi:hypothetical protein
MMQINTNNIYKKVYAAAFLGCIAVLPMSDTIALRNILLGIMLALFAGGIGFSANVRSDVAAAVTWVPIPLILWILYLCLFPLWAPLPQVAWENLRGQWGESILAWVVAFGAVVVLGKQGPGLWSLGIASAFPLLVHLALSVLALAGIWSSDFYDHQNLTGLYEEVSRWMRGDFVFGNFHNPIAERFHGIEVMHGNAGYASSVAIAIFTAIFLGSRDQVRSAESALSLLAIGLCFLSIVIFRSRGALLFGVFIVAAGFAWHYVAVRAQGSTKGHPGSGHRFGVARVALVLSLFLVIGSMTYWSVQHDKRWKPMIDKVAAGFMVNDPIGTLCQGVSASDEAEIRARLAHRSEQYVTDVLSGLKGQDGGRIVLMRAGFAITLEHPLGLDGSRQSYVHLITAQCGGVPALDFAHTHNSWIDLSLALGWAGALSFAWMLTYFLRRAASRNYPQMQGTMCIALFLLAGFWLVRGFFDSLYREHYLEMQAILLIYLYGAINLRERTTR